MRFWNYLKVFLPAILVVVIYVIAILGIVLPGFKQQLIDKKEETIKQLTVNVISILNHNKKLVDEGIIDIESAYKSSISTIRDLRYGEKLKDYFWIQDTNPVIIMHPYRPEMEGENVSNYKDKAGNLLFVDAVKICKKNGDGYINYFWQLQDDSSKVESKISYVRLYKPWGWIIGTGIYIEDVEMEIAKINRKILYFSLFIFVSLLLLAIYILIRNLKEYREKETARQLVKESDEKYREIVENANSIIIKLDLEGKVTFFNEFAQQLFGYTQEEIVGKSLIDTILSDDVKSRFSLGQVRNMIRNYKRFSRLEGWNYTKAGEKKFITWNNKPIFNNTGKLEGIISIGTDITFRKELIDRLADSQQKFKMIFNSVTDGILIFSMDGKIIEANQAAIDRAGMTKREYTSARMEDFFIHHPVKTFKTLVEKLGHKDFIVQEIQYSNKQGQSVNVEVVARKIEYEGETAYLAVTRDIAERINLQHKIYNAVIEAEENERSRVAKELHDGVSPILSTIKLYTQSLKDCSSQELKDEILRKIEETINESIQSVSDISNNLSPHILQNFGLIPALENFIDKVKHSKTLNINLDVNWERNSSLTIEVTIYRIITELINNTLKYAKANKVEIKLNSKEFVYLKYSDNGIGFDYDSIVKSKKGMGLFNISNRVESLKGFTNFNSTKGNGFTVEIEIPHQSELK